MEVRKGYKQTEIGVIPDDWDLRSLNTITQIVGGGTPSTLIDEYWNGKIPWIAAGDISNAKGRYVKGTDFHISELGLSNSSTKIMPKDTTIIIARGATVGRMAQLGKDMAFNQTCYCLLPREGLDKNYLYYSMLFSVNSIVALSFGTIFGTITTNSFKDWQIPFPTLAEQEAIAEALSDADDLIEAVEQLLTKKRQVKQGAMQELLTGKRRLSGFSGEWEPVSLIDLLTQNATYGIVKAGEFQDTGVPMVRGGDIKGGKISTSDIPFVTEEKSNEFSRTILKLNDVVIALVGYPGEAAKVTLELEGANISRAVGLLRLNNRIYTDYLVCYLNSPIGRSMVLAPSAGSAQQVVNLAALNKLKFKIPEMKEQTAIAEILSDMDEEISALEGKLVKVRQVKAGMMSELLSGKIRLV